MDVYKGYGDFMLYQINNNLYIRELRQSDIDQIIIEELKQRWHPTKEKYIGRLKDSKQGDCISLVAVFKECVAGYINIYIKKKNGPYKDTDIPEIIDLGVFEIYRNQGIGHALMDVAEQIAKTYNNHVYLAVGLHEGYGQAQRLYFKRGYIPDGKGAYYQDKLATQYEPYPLDDDLVIYMMKDLQEVTWKKIR